MNKFDKCPECGSTRIDSSFDRDAFYPGHDYSCMDCSFYLGSDK